MKRIKKLWAAVICMVLAAATIPAQPVRAAEGLLVSVQAADEGTLSYNYSETKKLSLKVANLGGVNAKNIQIVPRISENIDAWPFEIANKDYTQTIDTLAAGETVNVEFEFTAREKVKTQYYKLAFDYTYVSADDGGVQGDGEYGLYVKTVAKPKKDDGGQGGLNDNNNQGGNTGDGGQGIPFDTGGGIANSEPMMTSGGGAGGGSEGNGSVPRVIVTGFTTDPAEVKAGSNFKLTIHLKNTSKKTAVSNMLFDLSSPTEGADENTSAPAFLPASGSSSIYLDGIKADGTKDISIELNAKSDLVQKPYSVQLSMKYEDSQATQFESASAVSIPVKQDARFEFGEFQISPESVSVGSEANIMCELYNLGRVKLYNVKAKFEGNGIKTAETFVGNVESGATANIDGMVTAESPTAGAEKMKMTLSYEDEGGKVSTIEKEFQLEITEGMEDGVNMTDMPIDEAEKGFPIVPVVIVIVVIAGIVAGVIIYKKKKKRKLEEEEEGLVDEFDRLTEDEPREP